MKSFFRFGKFSVKKKITAVFVIFMLALFGLITIFIYAQMCSYSTKSKKEGAKAQADLISSSLDQEITTAESLLKVLPLASSSGATLSDTTVSHWLAGITSKGANLNLVVTFSDANSNKHYVALDGDGKVIVGSGNILNGGISIAEVDAVKKTSIVTSSVSKKGFIVIPNKEAVLFGQKVSIATAIPMDKIVNGKELQDQGVAYMLVNDNSDVLSSNINAESNDATSFIDGYSKSGKSLASFLASKSKVYIKDKPYVPGMGVLNDKTGTTVNVLINNGFDAGVVSFIVIFMLVVIGGMLVGLWLIYRTMVSIFTPIEQSVKSLKKVAEGEISEELKIHHDQEDEIGEMTSSINMLIDNINNTARFASDIGEGNLNSEYKPSSDNDKLGVALLGMQKSLIKAKELEESQKISNRKSQWANEGMARFAEILRSNHDNLKEMSFNVIKNLVKSVDAIQGGIFVLNDDSEDTSFLEMTACFAYDRRKMLQKRVELEEGLVGRCFFEKQPILLKEMPKDYLEITSGLGHENPRNLLLVPLKLNEEVNGVIELASFNEFEEYQIHFIEKIAESIASTIISVRVNERTNSLLGRSQEQAEQMAAQEEEMRQNLEELQATQEELEKRARENDKINKDLEKEKYLLDALLKNIPDFIYFKDEECKFIRTSESMAPLFQMGSAAELIGKSDFDFHSAEHANKAFAEEQEIIKTGKMIIDNIDHEVWDDGREQWVSSTKMPLVGANGKIVGMFGISKVITNIKQMEIEVQKQNDELKQNMARMEQVSHLAEDTKNMYTKILDNLPLKVFVKDSEGRLTVINDAVAKAHNMEASELLGKSDFDFYDYDTAKVYFDAEKKVMDGDATTYVHEESFDGKTKVLKTTKAPFFLDTINDNGLLGYQVDITEFAEASKQNKK